MSDAKYYHGYLDEYRNLIGRWVVTDREIKHVHTVEHARRILYRFRDHTHPYAQRLVSELIAADIDGLQRLDTETDLRRTYFTDTYRPHPVVPRVDPALCEDSATAVVATASVDPPLPEDGLPVRDLDFDYQSGAYAVYNWELFFHVPFVIALHLSGNGRYSEAQHWYHYIFDPTDRSDPRQGPKRFWKFKPFRIDEVEHIESVLFNLATGDNAAARDATARAIGAWRDNPFSPHLIARTRPTEYMYATVMAYLDNLVAWGDSLYRQDTRESINEATQLYVLAANVLGPRPQAVPERGTRPKETYATLKNSLDEFGNAAVAIEPDIAFDLFPPAQPSADTPQHAILESVGRSLYFCVPRNDKLLGYWDTVADRLFKIRNSLDLQGAFRQLPLFPPPIDPSMLARAVAAGVDVGAIVAGTAAELAPVRFQVLLQKAIEIAQDVKALEAGILAALEKKDGETLGVLRARHEVALLDLAEGVKYAQWQEAIKNREGTQVSLLNAFQRYRHYHRLLGTADTQIKAPEYPPWDTPTFEGRQTTIEEPTVNAEDPQVRIGESFRDGGHKVSPEEGHELDLLEATQIVQDIALVIDQTGSALNMIPDIEAAAKPWGLGAGVTIGGSNIGRMFLGMASATRGIAGRVGHEASLAGRMGNFSRREQEWALQRKNAAGELTQLYKQLRSAEIREYLAEREHNNHRQQEQQSRDVLEFLTNEQNTLTGDNRKISTEDFYLWMKREAQTLHAKAFQLAFDLAKKAERAWQYELADETRTFIQAGYLAGKEGLFAGDRLHYDLKQMEIAYLEQNRREYEITKHVSLAEWFPAQLIDLRRNGNCDFFLPEALFDLDCSGHSHRRIKSIAISVPCVTGPYTGINCSLTLTENHIRRAAGGYPADPADDTTNFMSYSAPVTAIVTSSGQSDAGVFDPNPRDERYQPFEGAGAISRWTLQLLGKPRPFDYDTIADIILTVHYTARTDGSRAAAEQAANAWLRSNAARAFSMKHDFPTEWAAFKSVDTTTGGKASLKFALSPHHYAYRLKDVSEPAKRLVTFFTGNPDGDVELLRGNPGQAPASLARTQPTNGGDFGTASFPATGDFELRFDSNAIDDLWIVVDWSPGTSAPG
jgi:hypothetical protein